MLGYELNLGWKLAHVISSSAPRTLLYSYQQERRPVAEQMLECSRAQVTLSSGERLNEFLRHGRALLLRLNPAGPLRHAATDWGATLDHRASSPHPDLSCDALLVGLDGVVAWTGSKAVASSYPLVC